MYFDAVVRTTKLFLCIFAIVAVLVNGMFFYRMWEFYHEEKKEKEREE